VQVRSHDGTMVPLSIVHQRGLRMDGSSPTLLQGYCAYGLSLTPSFSPTNLWWFDLGGVLAYAHVRGGGEYGEEWHHGGFQRTKPNSWKDFIACAEYLCTEKYTSPRFLAAASGSAGGIMLGRALTERPELFGAVTFRVAVLDAVRKETTPFGACHTSEFGSVAPKRASRCWSKWSK